MRMAIEADFKQALACWASGVSVVTVRSGDLMYGVTVSSFSSLSLNPPLILFCLNAASNMLPLLDETQSFAVNILAEGQGNVSGYFAAPNRDPSPDFGDIAVVDGAGPHPVLVGASAYLQCKLHNRIDEGDHAIVIGQVTAAVGDHDASPLVYFQRGYREITTN